MVQDLNRKVLSTREINDFIAKQEHSFNGSVKDLLYGTGPDSISSMFKNSEKALQVRRAVANKVKENSLADTLNNFDLKAMTAFVGEIINGHLDEASGKMVYENDPDIMEAILQDSKLPLKSCKALYNSALKVSENDKMNPHAKVGWIRKMNYFLNNEFIPISYLASVSLVVKSIAEKVGYNKIEFPSDGVIISNLVTSCKKESAEHYTSIIGDVKKELKDKSSRLEFIESDYNRMKNDMLNSSKRASNAVSDLNEATSKLTNINAKLNEAHERINTLSGELDTSNANLCKVQEEFNAYKTKSENKLNNLKTESENKFNEYKTKAEHDLAEAKNKIKELEDELAVAKTNTSDEVNIMIDKNASANIPNFKESEVSKIQEEKPVEAVKMPEVPVKESAVNNTDVNSEALENIPNFFANRKIREFAVDSEKSEPEEKMDTEKAQEDNSQEKTEEEKITAPVTEFDLDAILGEIRAIGQEAEPVEAKETTKTAEEQKPEENKSSVLAKYDYLEDYNHMITGKTNAVISGKIVSNLNPETIAKRGHKAGNALWKAAKNTGDPAKLTNYFYKEKVQMEAQRNSGSVVRDEIGER